MDTAHLRTVARPSPTLRASSWNLAKDRRGEGEAGPLPGALGTPPQATFPAAPGSPGFSVAAVARTRGQCFLTVWVTAARPQDGINWMGQNYPSLFLLFTLLSGKHPLQNHQGPLLRPSRDQGLLTTTNAN